MTRWLDAEEQVAWRAYLQASTMLTERLNRDLELHHGISQSEYEILVRLSETPHRRLRMALLADQVVHSRSRLTHTVARLERAGYVERQAAECDRRGVECVLTETGYALLEQAAHTHVEGVRSALLDPMSREQFLELGRVMSQVRDAMLPQCDDVKRDEGAVPAQVGTGVRD